MENKHHQMSAIALGPFCVYEGGGGAAWSQCSMRQYIIWLLALKQRLLSCALEVSNLSATQTSPIITVSLKYQQCTHHHSSHGTSFPHGRQWCTDIEKMSREHTRGENKRE